MDRGAMAMKRYPAFPKAPALLEPHHQIVYCHIQGTHKWEGGLTPLKRRSRFTLLSQPTGQYISRFDMFTHSEMVSCIDI